MATANPTDAPQQDQSEKEDNKGPGGSSEDNEDSEANRAFEVCVWFTLILVTSSLLGSILISMIIMLKITVSSWEPKFKLYIISV